MLCGWRVHDTTTGMCAYRRAVIEDIEWTENTGLSAELLLRPLMRGHRIAERPISYDERVDETKLTSFRVKRPSENQFSKSVSTSSSDK